MCLRICPSTGSLFKSLQQLRESHCVPESSIFDLKGQSSFWRAGIRLFDCASLQIIYTSQ